MDNAALNFEIKRKMFHLCGVIFPVFYIFFSKINMCVILAVITSITLYLDVYRHYNRRIKEVVDNFFSKLLRANETGGYLSLSGASYMSLGFLISCALFPKGLAITSWFVLIISDSAAAIVGMMIGSPLTNGKSYAGMISFFISAVFISIMSYFMIGYSTSFIIIIISSFLTAMVEFFSEQIKINDNLSIPFTYSLSTVILGFLL